MERDDMLEMCRYYDGKDINPFEGKDNNKAMLWGYERAWVNDSENNINYSEMISDLCEVGLLYFEVDNDMPTSYKALLFNRLSKGCQSMVDATPHFKDFYTEYYG